MPRLIDADKTIGLLKTRLYETALNNATAVCDASYLYTECADNRIEAWINELPTVDAVAVVRCEDCRYWSNNECIYSYFEDNPNGYCAWGERRDK